MSRVSKGVRESTSFQRTIHTDQECYGCGYNLRGLRVCGCCPECGRAIERFGFSDEPLSSMPRHIIRRFQLGAWAGAVAATALFVSWALMLMDPTGTQAPAVFVLSSSGCWVLAAFLLTPVMHVPEAVARGFRRKSVARIVARWGQFGWPVFMLCGTARNVFVNPTPIWAGVLQATGWLGVLGGSVALVALAVMMERLAEWTRDDDAQRAFHLVQWVVPIAILILLVKPLIEVAFGSIGGAVFGLIFLIALSALLLIPGGILMLARSISLADYHRIELEARKERQRRKRAQEAEDVEDLLRGTD